MEPPKIQSIHSNLHNKIISAHLKKSTMRNTTLKFYVSYHTVIWYLFGIKDYNIYIIYNIPVNTISQTRSSSALIPE